MTAAPVHLELQATAVRGTCARTTLYSAVVAASFLAAVLVIMLAVFLREQTDHPLVSDRVAAMKQQLASQPDNEALRDEIRQADLQLRLAFFGRRQLMGRGTSLVLFGGLILLVSLKLAARMTARPFVPDPAAIYRINPFADLAPIKTSLLFAALALGGVSLGLAAMPKFRPLALNTPRVITPNPGAPPVVPPPSAADVQRNWPAFRGSSGIGVVSVDPTSYATEWDVPSGRNLRWKSDTPLPGNSSPVVWNGAVFVTGATESRREVYCFDANSGRLRWARPVAPTSNSPAPRVSADAGYATPTMATDGRRAFAVFAGGDVAALDAASGNVLWSTSLGPLKNTYGHAASLLPAGDRLILQLDQTAEDPKKSLSVVVALDAATGKTLWQTPRPVTSSWSSPILAQTSAGPQIITCANPWVIAYDPATGSEIWRAKCLSGDVAPSPVFATDTVFSAADGAGLFAIRPTGRGDVTKTHVAWSYSDDLPDIVSPLAAGDLVLITTSNGYMTAVDAKTGAMVWQHDFEAPIHASPTLAGENIYLPDMKGTLHVFHAVRQFHEIASVSIGEPISACPAFAAGRIYFRSANHLYCVGQK